MCPISVQNVSNMLVTLWTYFGHIFTNQVIVQNMSISVSKSWTHFGHILDTFVRNAFVTILLYRHDVEKSISERDQFTNWFEMYTSEMEQAWQILS